MPSKREQVLPVLFGRLEAELPAMVRRKEALPERMPAERLVILREHMGLCVVTWAPLHSQGGNRSLTEAASVCGRGGGVKIRRVHPLPGLLIERGHGHLGVQGDL